MTDTTVTKRKTIVFKLSVHIANVWATWTPLETGSDKGDQDGWSKHAPPVASVLLFLKNSGDFVNDNKVTKWTYIYEVMTSLVFLLQKTLKTILFQSFDFKA